MDEEKNEVKKAVKKSTKTVAKKTTAKKTTTKKPTTKKPVAKKKTAVTKAKNSDEPKATVKLENNNKEEKTQVVQKEEVQKESNKKMSKDAKIALWTITGFVLLMIMFGIITVNSIKSLFGTMLFNNNSNNNEWYYYEEDGYIDNEGYHPYSYKSDTNRSDKKPNMNTKNDYDYSEKVKENKIKEQIKEMHNYISRYN